jgi:two-component system, chemotaxis family, protein-glutamate methylesterase/glutaminase
MGAIVVIAASEGGLLALRRIVSALPSDCAASVFIVLHIGNHRSLLPQILRGVTTLPVEHPHDDTPIEPNHIYVAPPDHHMVLEAGRIRLNRGPKVNHTRPAADPLFISSAAAYGERVIGIVLTGGGSDGAVGLRAIKNGGGLALVQDPHEAPAPWMPRAAITADRPDLCLSVAEIAERVAKFCAGARTRPSSDH